MQIVLDFDLLNLRFKAAVLQKTRLAKNVMTNTLLSILRFFLVQHLLYSQIAGFL